MVGFFNIHSMGNIYFTWRRRDYAVFYCAMGAGRVQPFPGACILPNRHILWLIKADF
jgi:hypothetical protein